MNKGLENAAAGAVAILLLIYAVSALVEPNSAKVAFAEEFSGAYQEKAEKNGTVVEVALTADEDVLEIFRGHGTPVWRYSVSEIRIQKGDTLRIVFTNNLPQETTLHFHGVRVPNAMDGVPGVTQEAVQPGASFVYEFTPKDAGTFWFHPHENTSEQMERGLYGVLIVEDDSVKRYSRDAVWVLDDWLLEEDYRIHPHFVTPHDLAHDGRWGNVVTVNGSQEEKLVVRPGERVLLRFVNVSNGRVYALRFGALQAYAVAVDGMYVKEVFDAEGFILAPGNRLDVDVVIPEEGVFTVSDGFTRQTIPLGTVVVGGERAETPVFPYPVNPRVPDWSGVAIPADTEYILDARSSSEGLEWMIGGETFSEHTPLSLKHGEFTTIKFVNKSFRLHPMHLHGQFFKVLSRDGVPVNEPYFRDTVFIGPEETVTVGLVPLDKGVWMNHCHILEHADAGMMSSVVVR